MSLAGNVERLGVELVEKRWPSGQLVLGAISFSLGGGEVVALSGPSGCGKSTLIGIIAGLDRDFRGRVRRRADQRLGVVFQSPRLLPWRTAATNVALALGGGRKAEEQARLALAEMGVADCADVYPAHLSLGMARRVALARALVAEPEILLLDEAFVSLDAAAAAKVRASVLAAVARRGMTVLMVSHDQRDPLLMADRELILGGTPSQLLAERRVQRQADAGPDARLASAQ